MLSTAAIPHKTAYGTKVIQHPTVEERKKLDLKLRQLLILVDGQRNIAHLLSSSVYSFDIHAFEMLYEQGYIAFEPAENIAHPQPTADIPLQTTASIPAESFLQEPPRPATTPTQSAGSDFSKTRFDCLDIMLDLSMTDFSARPWIDKFETTKDIYQLQILIAEFAKSPLGQQHSNVVMQLKKLV